MFIKCYQLHFFIYCFFVCLPLSAEIYFFFNHNKLALIVLPYIILIGGDS